MDVTLPEDFAVLRQRLPHPPKNVDVEAEIAAARRAVDKRDLATACDLLERLIVTQPELPTAWTLFGRTQEGLGNLPSAMRAYERALSLADRSADTALALAALYLEQGEKDRARALLVWLLGTDAGAAADVRERAIAFYESAGGEL